MGSTQIPVIDISHLADAAQAPAVAAGIAAVCREHGFFYVSGHGVSIELQQRIEALSREFFALPEAEKLQIAMSHGGKAWRGFFPVNAELTSGKPDKKEGIYFGTELDKSDARVQAGLPLHGANLFPDHPARFRETVLEYIEEVTKVGHTIMRGISLSLGLPQDYFFTRYNQEPLILFRIFHYPPQPAQTSDWGVGEHTDYGLLTILLQDAAGGLQVKRRGEWIEAPPVENTFICNIGDMLDKMTGGVYRSTPHRVRNVSGRDRFSFPLFFDPGFDTVIERIENIPQTGIADDSPRWDNADVHTFGGTYGEYLLHKIGKVFPGLKEQVL
jgi:isopenicillin N synthase-like dioxygenase